MLGGELCEILRMIENIIPAREASIGSMDFRRVLPFREQRTVGPGIRFGVKRDQINRVAVRNVLIN